jgi:hypothetical protein
VDVLVATKGVLRVRLHARPHRRSCRAEINGAKNLLYGCGVKTMVGALDKTADRRGDNLNDELCGGDAKSSRVSVLVKAIEHIPIGKGLLRR